MSLFACRLVLGSILGAASYLFIVGEIAPLRPREEDDGMLAAEPSESVA